MKKSNPAMQAIIPVRPPAAYVGGKSRLAGVIAGCIERIEHHTYCEPFVGMGGVFLRRQLRPPVEVINDLNRDISNLFRMLAHHHQPFIDLLRWQLASRDEFEKQLLTPPQTLTDLQRAVRFLYLQRLSFGGKVASRTFGVSPMNRGKFDVNRIVPMLEKLHARLGSVTIENLDYQEFIRRYDREKTLFYLDPPYYGHEGDYGRGLFTRKDFMLLARLLAEIKGRFILSLNDLPEIKTVFRRFHQLPVSTMYSVSKQSHTKVRELLISNTPLILQGNR